MGSVRKEVKEMKVKLIAFIIGLATVVVMFLPCMGVGTTVSVVTYNIHVRLSPEDHYIIGCATLEGYTTNEIYLNPSLKIKSVSQNGKDIPFHRSGYKISIPDLKEKDKLTVEYEGELFSEPVGSWLQRLQGKYRYCYIDRSSSFLMGEAAWYPSPKECVDIGMLSVDVPQGEMVIAPGVLEKVDTIEGRSIFSYSIQKPVPLISVATGVYDEYKYQGDTFEILVYTLQDSRVDKEKVAKIASDVIEFYSKKFVPYPYKKLSVVEASRYPGGHGDPCFVTVNFDFVQELELTLVHELGHQWFGDIILSKSHWQREGGAQFLAFYYLYDCPESLIPFLEEEEKDMKSGILANGTTNANIYKGAAVLDMLRYVVGDDVFFEALRRYIYEYSIPFVSTDDELQHVFEETCGEDLDWFFNGWLYEPGCPSYKIGNLTYTDGKTEFLIYQTGNFSMPVEIKIVTEKECISKKVWVSGETTPVTVAIDGNVMSIEIDPDNHILKE